MVKISEVLYKTDATNSGGRKGKVSTSDGVLNLEVRSPIPNSPYTNPEQLFAAGYSSCFNGAIAFIANLQKLNASDSEVTAEVTFGKTTEGGFGLAVVLAVKLPHLSKEEGQKLIEAAHQVCPYSVATRGNIEVNLKLID